jgi:hypothetical protein
VKLTLELLPPLPSLDGVDIRHIPGWIGYAVGDDGSVWTGKTRCGAAAKEWLRMKPQAVKSGHLKVQLSNGTKKRPPKQYVHQLVLITFIGPRPPGMESRHFPDPNPANNRRSNLSWASHARNMLDSKEQGRATTKPRPGTENAMAKLTDEEVRQIHAFCSTMATKPFSLGDIAKQFNVSTATVSMIGRGLGWKHLQLPPLPKFTHNCPRYGADNHATKLTPEKVAQIRKRYAAKEKSQVQLAAEYGVTPPLISKIIRNVIWREKCAARLD